MVPDGGRGRPAFTAHGHVEADVLIRADKLGRREGELRDLSDGPALAATNASCRWQQRAAAAERGRRGPHPLC